MTIEQKSYLGASISSINSNLGWGSSPSQITVELVEDSSNGDNFIQPSIGGPTFFEYYSLSLGGIIIKSDRNSTTGGDPTYSVVIEDPRRILDGVQLIINGYTGGVFNVPNLYNVFGYWESFSFGNSQVNSTGMPWERIRDGFLAIMNAGNPIIFGTTSYLIDLDELPSVPEYFRISGDGISLMDFISQVCESASHDFFFNLEDRSGTYYIKLHTVNRSAQPTLNNISTFVNSQTEVNSASTGFELRNEISSRFLVGGNVHAMYYQWQSGLLPTTRDDDVIWPFWGTDETNSVIIGGADPISGVIPDYMGNDHEFTLQSTEVNVVGVPDTYDTNIEEMRAALAGLDAWKTLISEESVIPTSPHFLKAHHIGIFPGNRIKEAVAGKTTSEVETMNPVAFADLTGGTITKATNSKDEVHEENISRLFEFVRTYASEYYGKKFMVRLPSISAKLNTDTNTIDFNLEPADGGFLDDILWSGGVANNLLPIDINKVSLDDNRITPYVKFDIAKDYDLSDLGPDDFTISNDTLFVKCTLDDEIYFENYIDNGTYKLLSPRVVINLPGRVNLHGPKGSSFDGGFSTKAIEEIVAKAKADGATDAEAQALAARIINDMQKKAGADALAIAIGGEAVMPDMVACPLRSNVDFYGPWYSIGVNGKTEFEKDETLVPWNYGGFATMNLSANAQISSALSNMQIGEGGSLELAGAPTIGLGAQLVNGGPYVTDINISVDTNGGVITTYRMQTWAARPGQVDKQFVDQAQKLKVNEQKSKREFRELNHRTSVEKSKLRGSFSLTRSVLKPILTIPKARTGTSSSNVIAGEMLGSGDSYVSNVVIQPVYHATNQMPSGDSYASKAINSLDTLFRPFSTDPTHSGLPHLETPTTSDSINGDSLNPFSDNPDFALVNKDFPTEHQHMHDASGYARGIGMRMPMWGTGWGYDTNDNPVPNSGHIVTSGDSTVFVDNYKGRNDLWKSGPIYMPWDDENKMWIGGGSSLQLGVMNENLLYRSSGLMSVWSYSAASGTEIEGNSDIYVYDWFLPSGGVIWSGNRVGVSKISGRHYVISAEPNC